MSQNKTLLSHNPTLAVSCIIFFFRDCQVIEARAINEHPDNFSSLLDALRLAYRDATEDVSDAAFRRPQILRLYKASDVPTFIRTYVETVRLVRLKHPDFAEELYDNFMRLAISDELHKAYSHHSRSILGTIDLRGLPAARLRRLVYQIYQTETQLSVQESSFSALIAHHPKKRKYRKYGPTHNTDVRGGQEGFLQLCLL